MSEYLSLWTGMPASVVWTGPGCGVRAERAVAGVKQQERQPRDDAGAELDDHVDPDRRPGEHARGGPAERDLRVEHAAGDAADGEGAGRYGEPDRQPEEPVAGLVLAGGHVEHHVAQGEGADQLDHGGGRLGVTAQGQGGDGRGVDDGAADPPGDHAAGDLRDPVTDGLNGPDPAADQRPHGHGRVVVAAGDVAAGVDHDHQGRARRQRGKRAVDEHAHHHDEGQEERSDRLDRVLADFRCPDGDGSNRHRFRFPSSLPAGIYPPGKLNQTIPANCNRAGEQR